MNDPRLPASELRLRDILDLPFPSELQAAPAGDLVAWVCNEGGCRNVWIASARAGGEADARRLTRYRGDDGRVVGQLRWTPDCDAVVYARGTQLADGPPPNPASAPDGAEAPEIWRVDVHQGVSTRIGIGHSPEVSPANGDIAWIHEGQVWIADANGHREPARLIRDRGQCSGLAWSPDGSRLAFVSDRVDHSMVGVCDLAERSVRWLSPGIDRDIAPTWSPDGERIAFIRLAESLAPTYLRRADGRPWSLWTADPRTGASRCAWSANDGAGSVFVPFPYGPSLLWTGSGELAFAWEGSGWLHVHAIAPGSAAAIDLTPGAFEVAGFAFDVRTDALVVAANKDDIGGRRLWRVAMATHAISALTPERMVVGGPAISGNGRVVALQADARTPLRPVWIDAAGSVRALAPASLPRDFPQARLVEPEAVAFRSPDGQEIHAQLFLPHGDGSTSARPAVVHFHGGPTRQMFSAWHPTESYHLQYGLNQVLASRGYVVLSVNYRGGSGRGLAFREPEQLGAGGASEYQDVIGAAHFLLSRPEVDGKRIGVYGMSYGGLLTALALARASHLYAAGVDWAGISNWTPAFADAPADVRELAYQSSPLALSGQWHSPVLFIHADDDRVVPFDQTIQMIRALRQTSDAEVECLVLPDEQHDFLRHDSWARAFDATADFFDRRIGRAA